MAKRTMTTAEAGAMRWKGVSKKARQVIGRKGVRERERRRAEERMRLKRYEKALRRVLTMNEAEHCHSIAAKALGVELGR